LACSPQKKRFLRRGGANRESRRTTTGYSRAAPYAAYEEMEFDVPVQPAGDVTARLLVRALEIMESCKILRQALAKLPPGESTLGTISSLHNGNGHQRVRSARGKSCTASRGKRVPEREPGACAHAHLCKHAGYSLDGDGARLADTP